MSVPLLLELPTSACVASVTMTLRRVTGVTFSPFTLEEQSFKWPGEVWEIDFSMPPFTNRAIAADWQAFALRLQGRWNHFLMGDPSARAPRGVATGTPLVATGVTTGSNILPTSGWVPNVTGILLKGDYIQVGSGSTSRLHMLVEDANSDGAGAALLNVEPAIKEAPSIGSAIVINNPRGVFRLKDDSYSWTVAPGPVYRLSFAATEVV